MKAKPIPMPMIGQIGQKFVATESILPVTACPTMNSNR